MNRCDRRRREAQQRKEDKTIARRMVMKDARRAGRATREAIAQGHTEQGSALAFSDPMPDDNTGGEGLLCNLVIGTRDDLSPEAAQAAAQKWQEIRRQYPNAAIYLCFFGYDEDPREIPHIPDAAEHVRQWARFAGIKDFEETVTGPLGPLGAAFLGACGVFGEEVRRNIKTPPATAKH